MCSRVLSYLHAAGHLVYAKSSHLYLQDMDDLHQHMPEEEFIKFTEKDFSRLGTQTRNKLVCGQI